MFTGLIQEIGAVLGTERRDKIEEGGDDYLHPLNMTIVGKEDEMEPQNGGKDEDDESEQVQG